MWCLRSVRVHTAEGFVSQGQHSFFIGSKLTDIFHLHFNFPIVPHSCLTLLRLHSFQEFPSFRIHSRNSHKNDVKSDRKSKVNLNANEQSKSMLNEVNELRVPIMAMAPLTKWKSVGECQSDSYQNARTNIWKQPNPIGVRTRRFSYLSQFPEHVRIHAFWIWINKVCLSNGSRLVSGQYRKAIITQLIVGVWRMVCHECLDLWSADLIVANSLIGQVSLWVRSIRAPHAICAASPPIRQIDCGTRIPFDPFTCFGHEQSLGRLANSHTLFPHATCALITESVRPFHSLVPSLLHSSNLSGHLSHSSNYTISLSSEPSLHSAKISILTIPSSIPIILSSVPFVSWLAQSLQPVPPFLLGPHPFVDSPNPFALSCRS
jgi:hypothetical protein